MQAVEAAERLAGVHGRDPWLIATALGIEVIEMPLAGRLKELYVEQPGDGGLRATVLAKGLSDCEARHMLSHAIGHHLLHTGDRASNRSRALWTKRHEREADDFAACLLVDGDALSNLLSEVDPLPDFGLAEDFQVDVDLLRRRKRLLRVEHWLAA